MWDGQIAAFKDRYRILVYDTRGHGESMAPGGAYTLELLAEDLFELLKKLQITRTHFVGLSMGGMIGQTVALKTRALFDRLVLADTGHTQTPETIAQWQERIRTAETQGMQSLVEPTLGRWFTEPFRKAHPEIVKPIGQLIASTPVAGYVGCCHAISKLSTTTRLKDIKGPVLAITGEQDSAAPGTRYIGRHASRAKPVGISQAAYIANI